VPPVSAADENLDAFVGKWQALNPEQKVLQGFVAASERRTFHAWGSLQYELQATLFEIEHEPVRLQKSLWWAEELQRLNSGSPRHPVTQALSLVSASWADLPGPMAVLSRQLPLRCGNTQQLMDSLLPFARVFAACESALFGGTQPGDGHTQALSWLVHRLPHAWTAFDRAMVPLHLVARHQPTAAGDVPEALKQDWLLELQRLVPEAAADNWYSEAQRRFTRRRLHALLHSKQPGIGPGHAWDAWRARRLHSRY